MFRADLHSHTTCSDGSLDPIELLRLAHKIGLSGLSITDHDTLEGYSLIAAEAKKLGLFLGSGVEFSCYHKMQSIHLLAYDFPLSSYDLRKFCIEHQKKRRERNLLILEKLTQFKMPISVEELNDDHSSLRTIGRLHIASLMVKKAYVKTLKEAFQLYLGEGRGCYVLGQFFTVPETIDVIHQVGGKAFLAHPHLIKDSRMLCELLKLDFDGIECYYGKSPLKKEKRWLKIAKHKGWLFSGGSDFHGEIKPHIPLGCSWVDEEAFHKIFQNNLA